MFLDPSPFWSFLDLLDVVPWLRECASSSAFSSSSSSSSLSPPPSPSWTNYNQAMLQRCLSQQFAASQQQTSSVRTVWINLFSVVNLIFGCCTILSYPLHSSMSQKETAVQVDRMRWLSSFPSNPLLCRILDIAPTSLQSSSPPEGQTRRSCAGSICWIHLNPVTVGMKPERK